MGGQEVCGGGGGWVLNAATARMRALRDESLRVHEARFCCSRKTKLDALRFDTRSYATVPRVAVATSRQQAEPSPANKLFPSPGRGLALG